jgi:hypothetical protein
MAFNGKTVLTGDFFLELFNALVFELDNLPAGNADQVVMMLVQAAGLISCLAITEMALFGDTALGKKFQGSVHGGITDTGVLLAQAQVKLLGGEMGTHTEELIEDGFPLAGPFQALGEHEFSELVFGLWFAHGNTQMKTDFNLF